jgi:hypothetical protein
MPSLEEGLIYYDAELECLQVKDGYPWNIVSPPNESFPNGSILWRIYKGISARKMMSGAKMHKYEGQEFVEVETLSEATIVSGANLQNYKFWRYLQEVSGTPTVIQSTPFPITQFPGAVIEGSQGGFFGFIFIESLGSFHPMPKGKIDGEYSESEGSQPVSGYFVLVRPDEGPFGIDKKIFLIANSVAESQNVFGLVASPQNQYDSVGSLYRRKIKNNEETENGYIEPTDLIGAHTINDILFIYSRIRNSVLDFKNIPDIYSDKDWRSADIPFDTPDRDRVVCESAYLGAVKVDEDREDVRPSIRYITRYEYIDSGFGRWGWGAFGETKSPQVIDSTLISSTGNNSSLIIPKRLNLVTVQYKERNEFFDSRGEPIWGNVSNAAIGWIVNGYSEYDPSISKSITINEEDYSARRGMYASPPRKKLWGYDCDNPIPGSTSLIFGGFGVFCILELPDIAKPNEIS